MKHKSSKEIISRYIDDELSPTEREAFSEHIGQCRDCGKAYEEMRAVHEMFVSAERYNAPYGFSDKVMAKAETGAATREWRFSIARIPLFLRLAECAFAFIIVIVGIASGYIMMMQGYGLERPPHIGESFFLDVFEVPPPDSLGSAYIAVMGGVHRER